MTAPVENPSPAEKHAGGLSQLVRWLNDERPMVGTGDDAGLMTTASRRAPRWVHGAPAAPRPEVDADPLAYVRIGPAPRCAVAGEMIALSVALIAESGSTYLGWPVHLEWSSSDPAVATVSGGGVVHVHSRGRVELTCRCEEKTGSVWLTVVEAAVAASVGLPVPSRPVAAAEPKEVRRALPAVAVAAPVARPRSPFALSRSGRRFVVRLVGAGVTGALIAIVLSQSPEEYFVVGTDAAAAIAARSPGRVTRPANRQASGRSGSQSTAALTSAVRSAAPMGDTSKGMLLRESDGRVVSVVAGSVGVGSTPAAAPGQPTSSEAVDPAGPAATRSGPGQTIARVAVSSSPAQLAEGETVRLAAAAFDDRGEAVAGRAVAWKSEDTDIATVDESGLVTARRAGTVTLVATSEGRTGRVTLTVGARRAAPSDASTSLAAPARESGAVAVAQLMRARIDEFVQALRERDGGRVATLYAAESQQDRKNLQVLLERLRRPETRFKTADPQLASPEVREMEVAGEFQLPMSWTTPFGRVRNQTPTFRATLEPSDGGWRLVGIRAVGKLD